MNYLISLFVLFSISNLCSGQDTHYWTYRFGTKAALMGGPAVGGLEDNSSVIYNPSLLSFIQNTSVSLNANIYQVASIVAKNGAGSGRPFGLPACTGTDFRYSTTSVSSQQFVAGIDAMYPDLHKMNRLLC